jgi:hypothetical protein
MKTWYVAGMAWFFACLAFGQKLEVFVKRGSVQFAGSNHSVGSILNIQENQRIDINPGALCMAKREGNIKELESGRKYTFDELVETLKKSKSFTESFVKTITTQQLNQKKVAGIATRGQEVNVVEYSPIEMAVILSDSIMLTVGHPPLVLVQPIKVYRFGGGDTLFLENNGLSYSIGTPPEPGIYVWTYKVQLGKNLGTADNAFVVPTEQVRKCLIHGINAYTESISVFSAELRELLLQEYYALQKVYLR